MTKTILSSLLVPAVILLAGCGGDEDDGGGLTCQVGSACADVAGNWLVGGTVNGTACGDGTYTEPTVLYTITQSGCSISATVNGATFAGGVNGSSVCWSGSFPDEGGTTTFTSMSVTVSGDSLTGSVGWTWAGGGQSCSGTTAISGTRQ